MKNIWLRYRNWTIGSVVDNFLAVCESLCDFGISILNLIWETIKLPYEVIQYKIGRWM